MESLKEEKKEDYGTSMVLQLEGLIDDINKRDLLRQLWDVMADCLKELDHAMDAKRKIAEQRVKLIGLLMKDSKNLSLRRHLEMLHKKDQHYQDIVEQKVHKLIGSIAVLEDVAGHIMLNEGVKQEIAFLNTVLQTFLGRVKLAEDRLETEKKLVGDWTDSGFREYVVALKDEALLEEHNLSDALSFDHVKRMKSAYDVMRWELQHSKQQKRLLLHTKLLSVPAFHALWNAMQTRKRPLDDVLRPYIYSAIFLIMLYQTIQYLLVHSHYMRKINKKLLEF